MSWGFVMGLKVDTQIIDKWLGTAMENYQKENRSFMRLSRQRYFLPRGEWFSVKVWIV